MRVDPSLVSFLAASPRTLAHSPACTSLLSTVEDPAGRVRDANATLRQDLPAHEPRRFVCAFRKADAIEAYEAHRAEWGLHHPMFIQTYDMGTDERGKPMVAPNTSTFYVFSSPLDAVREMAAFFREPSVPSKPTFVPKPDARPKGVRCSKVMGINELTLPGMLCHPIFDLELETAFYRGRLSAEEIEGSMHRFLSDILRFWIGQGWLDGEAFVAVSVKSKSRPTPKGFKVSLHAVPHILATKEMHDLAQEEFLNAPGPAGVRRLDLLTRARELTSGAPPDYVPTDLEFFDTGASKYNGIATAGSRKSPDHPFPTFQGDYVFYNGTEVDFVPCPIPPPHDPAALSPADLRRLIWSQAYTTPKPDPVCYTDAFVDHFERRPRLKRPHGSRTQSAPDGQGENGGAKRAPRGAPPVDVDQDLPDWPISDLEALAGRRGEVSKSPDGYPSIRQTLPEPIRDKVRIMHLGKCLCAVGLVTGTGKVHDGNGLYVAFTRDDVFVTCATGAPGHRILSTTDDKGVEHCRVINKTSAVLDGSVQPVQSVMKGFVHWAMLGREELRQRGESEDLVSYKYTQMCLPGVILTLSQRLGNKTTTRGCILRGAQPTPPHAFVSGKSFFLMTGGGPSSPGGHPGGSASLNRRSRQWAFKMVTSGGPWMGLYTCSLICGPPTSTQIW